MISDISSSSSSLTSSSSSSDEENLPQPRPKNENYVEQTVPQYNNTVFLEHFRVSRNVFQGIVERFRQSDQFNIGHSGGFGKLDAEYHILVFLWFAGHQTASFRDVSDRFNISISSLFRIIKRVTAFLSNLGRDLITWPSNEEKNIIEGHFEARGFPGVVGVIDGSHIKIDKPSEDADSYLNRKHFFSIQMQVVCDHQRKIRDIFIGYPGSVHDSRVFRTSPLSTQLEEKCGRNRYILGDGGYPCTRYLLTPYRDRGELTAVQSNYNRKLASSRYIIEHCFGILKQKFRQLYHVKLRSIEDICHFIRACCVLHNLALNDEFPVEEGPNLNEGGNEEVLLEIEGDGHYDDRNGLEMRNYVSRMLNF
ncbi:putative nuclease HARBI1 [Sitophilus oryzae]|uniref:Nuclease HARBI1 n=1 Tax=Sitophilus oryzae TaxID=7048 RepID=A0A6J2X4Q1_SITOR|nr:putative nuclease HARBI1 [Sitophilus oryzae]